MPYEEEEEEVVEVTPPAPILVEGEARMKYTFKAESGRELACNKVLIGGRESYDPSCGRFSSGDWLNQLT